MIIAWARACGVAGQEMALPAVHLLARACPGRAVGTTAVVLGRPGGVALFRHRDRDIVAEGDGFREAATAGVEATRQRGRFAPPDQQDSLMLLSSL